MQARAVILAALCVSLGACANGDYFAYVVDSGQAPNGFPGQHLQLAQMTDPTGPAATLNATLLDTTIPDGNGSSSIGQLWASPRNYRLLAFVDEVGSDFHDQNLDAWDMLGVGVRLPLVNELSVAGIINRKNCPSAVFAAYLATQEPPGTPQSVLDAVDYHVPMDPQTIINLPAPQISGWVDDLRVALSWTFPFNTTDGASLQDTFQVIVTWPGNGDSPTIACVSQLPAVPNPPTALTADPTIRLRGVPVKWPPNGPIQAERPGAIAGVIKP